MIAPLLIDYRDGSKDLLKYLPSTLAVETTLEFGDAMVMGYGPSDSIVSVGVEVKSVSDLLSSVNTGRLQGHQLPGMLRDYAVPWLLYYGSYRPGDSGNLEVRRGKTWTNFRLGSRPVPYIYLEGILLDLCAVGIRVKHVFNAEEAAAWLICLHRWWSKKWSEHKGLKVFDCSKEVSLLPGLSAEQEQIATIAQKLPGIGFDRAMAVAHHFPSVERMILAGAGEWAEIVVNNHARIGWVVARAVVGAIERRWK